MHIARLAAKNGQLSLSKELLQSLGIKPGDMLAVDGHNDYIFIHSAGRNPEEDSVRIDKKFRIRIPYRLRYRSNIYGYDYVVVQEKCYDDGRFCILVTGLKLPAAEKLENMIRFFMETCI